jgi:hypothetical protein
MNNFTGMKNCARIAAAAFLSLLGSPLLHADETFNVTIGTTPLDGVSGYMAFDLYGANGFNNLSTITVFSSDSTLGTASTSGDVSGTLVPGPLTLKADDFFNEWLQPVTFGNLTTFTLDVTTTYTSGTPDSFAFFLLDSTETPYATSDPSGADSVFSIDLTGPSTVAEVYTSTNVPIQFTATVTPQAEVPETSPGPAIGLGLAAILALRFLPRRSRLL